jgi:hypothetical protein
MTSRRFRLLLLASTAISRVPIRVRPELTFTANR